MAENLSASMLNQDDPELVREATPAYLLLLDSLTRLAMAQREIGLLMGEPPSARGYTPSVFQLLSHTLEKLGTSAHGSITGIVTVLVDGDDMDEPIADAVRATVDGHIVLDRSLAEKGHYPAINVNASIRAIMYFIFTAPEKPLACHRDHRGKQRKQSFLSLRLLCLLWPIYPNGVNRADRPENGNSLPTIV